MTSKHIRFGYRFRHYGEQYGKKPGLYFENIMGPSGNGRRLSDNDIVDIRDWLSRYINRYIHKKPTNLTVEARAHSRSVLRLLDEIEAKR